MHTFASEISLQYFGAKLENAELRLRFLVGIGFTSLNQRGAWLLYAAGNSKSSSFSLHAAHLVKQPGMRVANV
jgi:hypothetical protein